MENQMKSKEMKDDLTIRSETPTDYAAILWLTYKAFLTLDYPGRRYAKTIKHTKEAAWYGNRTIYVRDGVVE